MANIDTNITTKAALVTDLDSSYVSKEQYSHGRNLVRNSKDGNIGTIGNEPSTELCWSTPYKILGTVPLPDGTILVFSGDNISSEIGIGNPKDCSYTTVKNLSCLNFSDKNQPITGVAKKDFNKGVVVTFTDKANPVRRAELSKLSSLTDCDDILLWKKISQPCITVSRGQVGNMPNGVYSLAIAYSVDGQVFSDWYGITNRLQLYSDTNSNSIEVSFANLDSEFEEFTLAVVGNYIDPATKGATKLAKIIGNFSTKTRTTSITDFINSSYKEIPLSNLVIRKNSWQKAGIITSNSNYLVLGDLISRSEENYQLRAMDIEMEYVVEQVPAEYYDNDGFDVGYYRDENYSFYIQGIYTTGELTDAFHIPGRRATSSDLALVSSADVYEYDKDFADCAQPGEIRNWQVNNTAGEMVPYSNPFVCGRRVLGYGAMGYHQSIDVYPYNNDTYGVDAGQPIRYPKMPDECKVPRYSVIDGRQYVNILGVRFKNIKKFDSPDVVGYRIIRADRKGGNGTVIARGLMTNVRSYDDNQTNQTVMYSNYSVNDLSPDAYISSTQTAYKNGKEHDFNPLKNYYKDKFNFYSPHTLFEPKYSLGTELKIESEEVADITGKFEKVHNHPKQRLMNQFAFWLSASVGFIESLLVLLGKTHITTKSGFKYGLDIGAYYELDTRTDIDNVGDLIAMTPAQLVQLTVDAVKTLDPTKIGSIVSLITATLQTIAGLAIKPFYATMLGIAKANEILDIIYGFTGFTDYFLQYNAHASFNRSICVKEGNKRRRLVRKATYIPSDTVSIDDRVFNNYFRENTVLLELNKEIKDPSVKDNSRGTLSSFGACDNPFGNVKSVGSAFYATSKAINPNQYGSLGSAPFVSMHSCILSFEEEGETTTPILYGGDCIIARFQLQKRMQFFNQNIANANLDDGIEYDYRLYRNIGYPRFWVDSSKYDFSQLISSNVVNFTKFSRTTTSKYNLDCKKTKDGGSITRIDNAYMYLSNNCVLDFFVECDYNINFREKTEKPFYSKNNTNLSQIFRSDRLTTPEEFKISRVYSDIYTTEIFAEQQRDDFDPLNPIPIEQPNSVIYSLPSFNLQNIDNWQYFLPANYFAFRESDFGTLTAIHKVDQDRLIFLFSKSSPYYSIGRDFLQLEGSGRKITIGDGGLFAQDPREIMPTDNNYGACNSRFAFSNTHLGRFYPAEKQGRIINSDSMDDVARQGISYWCKNYMPIFLYKYFPDYPEVENPMSGVGYLAVFDSFYETVYISKRDFAPRKELIKDILWDKVLKTFTYKGSTISLRDPNYFVDVSWTLSYSPLDKAFVSWHDWHPDLVIQTDNHFMTVKGNSVWKHNERFDNYCNFYGVDYPFEIEGISSSGQVIETVRSIEYILEVYKYKNFGRDKFHVHHENFDRLIVSNSEQISPLLHLVYGAADPEKNLDFPKKNPTTPVSFDVLYFKEENKYRINQFWDAVKDRGEFTNAEVHLFPTDESGYKQVVNPLAVDMNKPEEQRKKFRHYFNKFRFIKTISGDNKFIFKIHNIKKLQSPR